MRVLNRLAFMAGCLPCWAIAASTFLAIPASAHALLERSIPAASAIVPKGPAQVRLDFSEGLEPALSRIAVVDASGHDMTLSPAIASGMTMIVRLKPLSAGTYRVKWQVLSVDTHHTEGSFRFRVKP